MLTRHSRIVAIPVFLAACASLFVSGCQYYEFIKVTGTVYDAFTGLPLKGVAVGLGDSPSVNLDSPGLSGEDGRFEMMISTEKIKRGLSWVVTFETEGYFDETVDVTLDVEGDRNAPTPVIVMLNMRPGKRSPKADAFHYKIDNEGTLNLTSEKFGRKIGDVDLEPLLEVRHIEELWLGGTDVTDHGLRSLIRLSGLKRLFLYDTAITDAGIEEIIKLPQLEELDLRNTKVTDEGLDLLPSMKHLKLLHLGGTKTSLAASNKLEAKLADLDADRD